MTFDDELKFEKNVIDLLIENGWEKNVLRYKTMKSVQYVDKKLVLTHRKIK